MLKADW